MLSPLQKQLLNNFQQDFPVSPQPYLEIAKRLGVSENEVLTAFKELADQYYISRIGPIIAPNHIGKSTLVAMAIPPKKLTEVANQISQLDEVNHNYERDHHYNLWFVLISENQQHLQTLLKAIEMQTGYIAMQLPLLKDYFINLGFQLDLQDQLETELLPA